MSERESITSKGFLRKNGVLLATGAMAVALVVFAASGVRSHNHDTTGLQLAAACGAHGSHPHGEACSMDKEKNESGRIKSCPLINGSDKDGKCPVKALIGNKVVCPVMENRTFTVTDDTIAVAHGGKVYFMCCSPCEGKFKADPEKYTGRKEKESYRGHRH